MRVVVASSFTPSWEPPGDHGLADALELALRESGHEVESVRVPFDPAADQLCGQLLALRLTDLGESADLLLATGTPSHLLRHDRKVLWFAEHYRWIADLDSAPASLRAADQLACSEAHAAFAVSQSLCDRVARFSGASVVLLPPPDGAWDVALASLTPG